MELIIKSLPHLRGANELTVVSITKNFLQPVWIPREIVFVFNENLLFHCMGNLSDWTEYLHVHVWNKLSIFSPYVVHIHGS